MFSATELLEGLTYAIANEAGIPMSGMLTTERSVRLISRSPILGIPGELTKAKESAQEKANGQ